MVKSELAEASHMLLLAEAMQAVERVCNSSVSLFSSRVKQNHFNFVFVSHLYECDLLFYEKKNKGKKTPTTKTKKKKTQTDLASFFLFVLVLFVYLEGFLAAFFCVQIHMPSWTGLTCGSTGSSASQLHLQPTA